MRGLSYFPQDFHLLIVGLVTLVIIVFKAIFITLRTYYSTRFVNKLRSYWSVRILDNYLFSNYTDLLKHKRGELINDMIHEPMYASKALYDMIDFLANCIISGFIVALLITVNWQMTVALGVLAGVVMAFLWNATKRYSVDVGRKKIKLNQQISQTALEAVSGARQLKIFSVENIVIRELSTKLDRLMQIINAFTVVSKLPLVIGEVLIALLFVGFLLLYQYGFKTDTSTLIPVMGLFVISSLRLFSSLSQVVAQRMAIISYLPSLDVVHKLSRDVERDENGIEDAPSISVEKEIKFQDVDYEFEKGSKLLNKVTMEFPVGRITAVVGASGVGKSTVCDLVTQLFQPTKGAILVDGRNLLLLNGSVWRNSIGYVSQEPFLFNASIKENIMVGRSSASEKEMMRAAELSYSSEFIEQLPQKYDTLVGESGVLLSGGQRQRLAIARALIRDPHVLILDEATSALDAESERHILETLKLLTARKSIIFITHRLSSLWVTDFIYFLDKGRIVESGTLAELIAKEGPFSRFLKLSEGNKP